jgi:hypothetical protein
MPRTVLTALFVTTLLTGRAPTRGDEGKFHEVPTRTIDDKIRGGLLGQLLGNLNGLPHEMKYIAEPGRVESYTPSLPQGAWTDDDTDIEWVYVRAMKQSGTLFLPPDQIAVLWKRHINRNIWCANRYARDLMDLGIEPPLTGRMLSNPWSDFNISGQFLTETFALLAPTMPRTAAKLALHYTHVGIDGEPAQVTQLCAAMIATAFREESPDALVAAGLAAVDPDSEIHSIVAQVVAWWKANPTDWRTTRRLIRDAYTRHGGEAMRDKNGYELNTASTIAALLYGHGDFTETLRLAFNNGWDADNNAATCGAVLGVIHGRRWMDEQGWTITDRYANRTRDAMPDDETISSFGDTLCALARQVIREQGGTIDDTTVCIPLESPGNIERLPVPLDRRDALRSELRSGIASDLTGSPVARARAAYLALCLGEHERLRRENPEAWSRALDALRAYPQVLRNLFDAPAPEADTLKAAARAEGLERPKP